MASLASEPDVFGAIAEPFRREILELLGRQGRMAVSALVEALRRPQPTVSKHLGVLRRAGLVTVSKLGRQRVYEIEAAQLRAVHEWTRSFERFWDHKLDRIRARAERAAGASPPRTSTRQKGRGRHERG